MSNGWALSSIVLTVGRLLGECWSGGQRGCLKRLEMSVYENQKAIDKLGKLLKDHIKECNHA